MDKLDSLLKGKKISNVNQKNKTKTNCFCPLSFSSAHLTPLRHACIMTYTHLWKVNFLIYLYVMCHYDILYTSVSFANHYSEPKNVSFLLIYIHEMLHVHSYSVRRILEIFENIYCLLDFILKNGTNVIFISRELKTFVCIFNETKPHLYE